MTILGRILHSRQYVARPGAVVPGILLIERESFFGIGCFKNADETQNTF